MLLVYILLVIIAAYIFKFHWQRRRLYRLVNKFDGPKSLPLIGNLNLVLTGTPTDIFFKFCQLANRFPLDEPYRFWHLHTPFIVLRDPEDLRAVARLAHKNDSYRLLSELFGEGILMSNGDKWKRSRVVIEPALNTSVLSGYYLSIFNRHCKTLMQALNEVEDGKTIDLFDSVFRTEIASIYETVTGFYDESSEELVEYFRQSKFTQLVMKRAYSPWLYPSFAFNLYLRMTGNANLYKRLRSLFLQAVLKRRKSLKEWKNANMTSEEKGPGIIDSLLSAGNFNDENIVDETITLLMAGTETSGVTVCFTLLMLAINPHIQERVWQELQNVFEDNRERPPTVADLSKLAFLEQCIKETLRKFSVIPANYRLCLEDVKLKDGRIIPAGANVILFNYAVHHDPRFYTNPHEWNPHNFDAEKVANRHNYAFIPFSIGPRTCVGYKYAMMSTKLVLCTILREYRVSAVDTKCEIEIDFVTKSKNGYKVQLNRRNSKIK